jgi:hypothetical protein
VQISTANGAAIEIVTGQCNGSAGYWTITHKPDGTATSACTTGAVPPPTSDMLVFSRRWFIETNNVNNPSGTGVAARRITVRVSLPNLVGQARAAAGSFQTSTVRP